MMVSKPPFLLVGFVVPFPFIRLGFGFGLSEETALRPGVVLQIPPSVSTSRPQMGHAPILTFSSPWILALASRPRRDRLEDQQVLNLQARLQKNIE